MNIITFWSRLCSVSDDCSVKDAFHLGLTISFNGKVTWMSSGKYILQAMNESLVISKIYNISKIFEKVKLVHLDGFYLALSNNKKFDLYNTTLMKLIFIETRGKKLGSYRNNVLENLKINNLFLDLIIS